MSSSMQPDPIESSSSDAGAPEAANEDPGGEAEETGSPDLDSSAPTSPLVSTTGTADWTEAAVSTAHVFVSTSSSADSCFLNAECLHSGNRMKCVSCRIICHEGCISLLKDRFKCRESFRECVRKYREKTTVEHHWIQRRSLKGKCKHCGKAFQSKLGFGSSKDVVGYSCSWCKYSYHNKDNCMNQMKNDTECDLGVHANLIVPPSWIVKLPRKGSFKSSLKNSPKKQKTKNILHQKAKQIELSRPFCIKPIPSPDILPLLVFLNPKSGGNQGAKLMQKFQWLLNPRQVFDLTQGGPGPAIELFSKTPNLRLLACGGDGTVGWLLSVLDKVKVDCTPAVGVLPLGTGNDLSRSLGWGGGYVDEPISRILQGLQGADQVNMDRWKLEVERDSNHPSTDDKGEDKLPLNVVNNYFSLGVDAQIALQFHEAREANPQKFNSRIRNKMFYGQAGGKDLLLRKWKDLSDYITVECDGQDITPKLKEHKVHSVLFANIPSFGSGTRPWDRSKGDQRIDDGLIEVIGLTTYQLPMLQAGGHGSCITQCKTAVIKTTKTIPMQVDGEASRLNPACIKLGFLNSVRMLAKTKGEAAKKTTETTADSPLKLNVCRIVMTDYEANHYDKDRLKELAAPFGEITTTVDADLEQVRTLISRIQENNETQVDWCFVDSVTAVRFFRIDRAQENLHYVMDICDEAGLYILETDTPSQNGEYLVSPPRSPPRSPSKPPSEAPSEAGPSSRPPSRSPSRSPCPQPEVHHVEVEVSSSPTSPMAKVAEEEEEERPPSSQVPLATPNVAPSPLPQQCLEKTTEGILKAARLGDLEMLRELHDQGYSLLSIDETGKTALHYGARFGHKEIIKFLLGHAPAGILDMVDNEKGQTALHKAAGYKRRTICCMLVAAGSSLTIKDQAGLTPRQLALMAEDHELAAYLESQEHFQTSCNNDDIDFETPV